MEEHPAFLDCKFYEKEALTRDVKFQSQKLSIGCTLPRHLNSLKDTPSHRSVATRPQLSVCPTLSCLSRMHRNHGGSIPKKQGPRETSASQMPRGGLSGEITVPGGLVTQSNRKRPKMSRQRPFLPVALVERMSSLRHVVAGLKTGWRLSQLCHLHLFVVHIH